MNRQTMSVEEAGKALGKLYNDCIQGDSKKNETLVIKIDTNPSLEILEADIALLLKQAPVTADKDEPLEWRWIMNASSTKANMAGITLNRLGIRWIKSMPEIPDIEMYDCATCTMTGFQVWCSSTEHKRLLTVTKIMQPYFT